jgi:hypothetical protein
MTVFGKPTSAYDSIWGTTMDRYQVLEVRPSIAGRAALITGGMSGIGRACVEAQLARGADVAFTCEDGRKPTAPAQLVTKVGRR